jgi:hypothetical protein
MEQSFQERPPASIKEAGERIFQLTGIRRSKSNVVGSELCKVIEY